MDPLQGTVPSHNGGDGHPAAPTTQYILVPGMQLPLPGTPQAPYFNGENITAFLEQWDDICEDLKVSATTKRD